MTSPDALPEAAVEKMARAMCVAAGRDPDELTYHHNGEIQEPYGPMWVHWTAEARAAWQASPGPALAEALKFYATVDNWHMTPIEGKPRHYRPQLAESDAGRVARQALAVLNPKTEEPT